MFKFVFYAEFKITFLMSKPTFWSGLILVCVSIFHFILDTYIYNIGLLTVNIEFI